MRLDLNLSQSCPWCHWELKSFHRIYINIKLDSFRALWAILILLMNTCSSLHCRYYSPEFFFLFYSKEFAHFYPFENKIFCKSIWDVQYMHVDFVLKVNAPLCPSAFSQSLKCIKVCYLRGWMPLLYHQIFIHILFKVLSQKYFLCSKI